MDFKSVSSTLVKINGQFVVVGSSLVKTLGGFNVSPMQLAQIGESPLPYTELPYCLSRGFSYSNTSDIFMSPNIHRFQTKTFITDLNEPTVSNIYLYMGSRTSSSTVATKANLMIIKQTDTTYNLRADWGRASGSTIEGFRIGVEYDVDLNPETCKYGDQIWEVPEGNYPVSTNPLWIGIMYDSTILGRGYEANAQRIYPTKVSVYATGEVILDTAIHQMKDTGEIKIYDKVRQDYLPNVGTEPYTYDKGEYPDWVYEMGTPIYGIKTTGTSWFTPDFELGYTGKTIIKAIADNASGTKGLYGWYSSTGDRVVIGVASGKWFSGKNNTNYNKEAVVGEPVTITMDRDGNLFTVNENTVPLTAASSDLKHQPYLGHRSNTVGGVFSLPFIGIIQLWQEYTTDGTLLRNSIPFIRNDGTVGRLDLITRNFEGSATETPFEPVTESSIAAEVSALGITPSSDVGINIQTLTDMGVSI